MNDYNLVLDKFSAILKFYDSKFLISASLSTFNPPPPPIATTVIFTPFYQPIKSLLLGTKFVFKHQDSQIFGPKIKQIRVIFTHLKLWAAVARHNFKWVKNQLFKITVSYGTKHMITLAMPGVS